MFLEISSKQLWNCCFLVAIVLVVFIMHRKDRLLLIRLSGGICVLCFHCTVVFKGERCLDSSDKIHVEEGVCISAQLSILTVLTNL